MANYTSLKTAIQNVVKTNGNNEITGALLQQTLFAMVNSLGAEYQFLGRALPSTVPGTPDHNVAYIGGAGTYPNFDNAVVQDGNIGVFKYNGSWTIETIQVGKNYDAQIEQLEQAVNGGTVVKTIEYSASVDNYRIPRNGGAWTGGSTSVGFSIDAFSVTPGKTYHLVVPKMSNAYTAVYAFGNTTVLNPSTYQLPSPVVTGPATNAQYDIVIPNGATALYVCFEIASGRPILTTTEYENGLTERVDALELEIGALNSAIEAIQEEITKITVDTNETEYENVGQIDYYTNRGTSTYWRGTGTTTPALSSSKKINKIIFPPFSTNGSVVKYFIGYRVYNSTGAINTPETALTRIAEGIINDPGHIYDFSVNLSTPVTVPAGNEVIILLYCPTSAVYVRGGGNVATENAPYNSDDVTAFLLTTENLDSPFSVYWSRATSTTTARYKVCSPILKYVEDSKVTEKINAIVPGMVNAIVPGIVNENLLEDRKVNVYLPNKLYAVVGDTLQIFFQSVVAVVNIADYDIFAVCSKGKTFPRYYAYTPVAGDIGTTTFTVYVKDRKNNIVGQASCDLITVAAPSSPLSLKSIFTFGDSLTSQGQWPGEAKRRLVGNSVYDGISGKGLSNIAFYGYLTKIINEQSVNYFGVGGWTWANYLSKATGGAFRFYVEGVTLLSIGATYTNNGYTYTIQEINVTGESGNIRCTTSSANNTPSASGTLTKTGGDGDETITFTSFETENQNPLWDDANNKMSFIPYVQGCGANTIDAVFVLLTWNGQGAWKEYAASDTTDHIANAKTFARTLHAEYPSAKLFIMGIQMPSLTGGLGYNYGASGGLIDAYGLKQCALNYNKALQDLCNLDEFSPYCEFVATAPQFDSLYNMPYVSAKVNVRNSATEMQGRNGVHPSDAGYFQIADAVYRMIVAKFCQ